MNDHADRGVQPASLDADRLTVAMVIGRFHPRNLGGAERQLESLCPLLSDRGVRPVLIARRRSGPEMDDPSGPEVIRVWVPRRLPALASLAFALGALRVLRKLRPDVVHSYGALSHATIGLLHKRRTGTPFVTKVLRAGPLGDLHRLAQKPFGRRRLSWLAQNGDAFVAISSEIDHELAMLGIEPARRLRIPNGVDLNRFSPPVEAERPPLDGVPSGAKVVVAVGRLSPEKRLAELARHWEEVRAVHPNAVLAVVGKVIGPVGPNSVRLPDLPGVVAVGARSDVEDVYRSAHLYVSASVAEGLSNALLEAMASGLPCVVTDVSGARDVISPECGVVVPPDDFGALTAAVTDLLSEPDGARVLGRRAREVVRDHYSLESVADRLAAAYMEMAQHPPANS